MSCIDNGRCEHLKASTMPHCKFHVTFVRLRLISQPQMRCFHTSLAHRFGRSRSDMFAETCRRIAVHQLDLCAISTFDIRLMLVGITSSRALFTSSFNINLPSILNTKHSIWMMSSCGANSGTSCVLLLRARLSATLSARY
jgi:hypothetical protein